MILSDNYTIEHYQNMGLWVSNNLYDIFRKNFRTYPERLAVSDAVNKSDITKSLPRKLTYMEIERAINNLLVVFAETGLQKDDIVAVQLPNTTENIIVYLAAIKAGLIISPIPILWRKYEIDTALSIIEPKAIITATSINGYKNADMMRYVAAERISVRIIMAFGKDTPDGVANLDFIFNKNEKISLPQGYKKPEVSANDIATICWDTRKSTAHPVARSHNQWLSAGMLALLETEIKAGSNILSPYPLVNLASIGIFFIPWLLTGGTIFLHHPYNTEVLSKLFSQERIDYCALPPTVINHLRNKNLFDNNGNGAPATLGCIWPQPSSNLITSRLYKEQEYPFPIVDFFPLGEFAYFAKKRDESEDLALIDYGECKFPSTSSAGITLLTTKVKGSVNINGCSDSLLIGDLLVKTPMMYDEIPIGQMAIRQKVGKIPNREKSQGGFVNTGLRCKLAGQRISYLDVLYANNDIIIHGSTSISSHELDSLYSSYSLIKRAASFTIKDMVFGEKIIAAIVTDNKEKFSYNDFINYLDKQNIAEYKKPDRIMFIDSIPKDNKGNIIREKLVKAFNEQEEKEYRHKYAS